jgi:alpha-ketoglutarate-dependent taurine dioxygenase
MTALAGQDIPEGTDSRATAITVRRLQPTIGAEITGVDLAQPLSTAERDEIKAAILKYKVVFFRGQDLDREQHAAFARQFGPLYISADSKKADASKVPPAHLITRGSRNKNEELFVSERAEGWDIYHTDTSWRLVPTWGAVLRAVTVPEVGGDTIWVDAGLAYHRLPEDVKERLEGLFVTHDYRPALLAAGYDYPIVAHPAVRTHRETGKKILWVNFQEHPWIVGLGREEGREILELVHNQYRKPEYQVRFHWEPGSIAFWDNRATVHIAVINYGYAPRLLERILIADEPQWADL